MPPIDKEMQLIGDAIRRIAGRTGSGAEIPIGRGLTEPPTGLLHGRRIPPGFYGPSTPEPIPPLMPGGYDIGNVGPYGPSKLASRVRRGATTLDDVRNALIRKDPTLQWGVGGIPPRPPIPGVPPSSPLVPPVVPIRPPIPPGMPSVPPTIPPSAASLMRRAMPAAAVGGLALRGDTPGQSLIPSQPVPNSPLFNAAGIPSALERPPARPVPNVPVYNTVGIPPNINSPRAAPPPTAPPGREMVQATSPTGPAPNIPLPRSRPSRMHPHTRQGVAEAAPDNESILSALLHNPVGLKSLFPGPVDKYGRRFEPASYATGPQ